MGYRDWSRAIRSGRFVQDCRERRRKQGYDPYIKPSHRWLHDNGFSGIHNYARRNDITVDELLLDELGFKQPSYDFAIDDGRTRTHVEQFVQMAEEDNDHVWGQSTIPSIKSHLKKIGEASRRAIGTDDLVSIGNQPRGVANDQIRKILAELEDMLESGIYNYARSFSEFMMHLENEGVTEYDRMLYLLSKKNYRPAPEPPDPEDVPTPGEVYTAIDNALDTVGIGITLMAGAGIRPTHVTEKTKSDCHLDLADPYVHAGPDNKTGPTNRALVGGREFLGNYIDAIAAEQTGDTVYLFPSKTGKSPYLSYGKFLDKVKEHCRELDLTDSNGEPYKPKSFKQFYITSLIDASMMYEGNHVKRATEFIGDKDASTKRDHYPPEQKERDHFRKYAEAQFRAAFKNRAVTVDDIRKARAVHARDENQSGLSEFVD